MLNTNRHLLLLTTALLGIAILTAACRPDDDLTTPPVNRPPVLLSDTLTTAYADSLFLFTLQTDDPEGDPVSIAVTGLPAWLSFIEETLTFNGVPARSDEGAHLVEIRLSDGQNEVTHTLRIDVLLPFSFRNFLAQTVTEGFSEITSGLAGVSVAVVEADGTLSTVRRGSSHFALDEPIKDFHQYRVASISKTFTAALIIRMAEEGFLDLDDRLIYHLRIEGLEYESQITIRQLLTHTAGVFDHLNSDVFWGSPEFSQSKVWTNEEIFQFAVDQGAYFEPGTGYHYSNTGIYILGAVAEEILQQPLGQIFEEWIFGPLGLEDTFYDDFSSESNPIPNLALSERAYEYHLSAAGAAGAVVSTPIDIARFGHALYGGQFIQPEHLDQMLENTGGLFNGGDDYGLGTRIWFDHGIYHYGHTGSLMDYRNILMYVPEKGVSIAVHANAAHPNWFGLVNHILVEVEAAL